MDDSSLFADADDDGNHALFLINIANQTVSFARFSNSKNCRANLILLAGHPRVDRRQLARTGLRGAYFRLRRRHLAV